MSYFYNRWVNASEEQKEEIRRTARINSKINSYVGLASNFIEETSDGNYAVDVKGQHEIVPNWKMAVELALQWQLGEKPSDFDVDGVNEKTFVKAMKKRFGFSQSTFLKQQAAKEAKKKRAALIKAAAILKDKHPEAAAAIEAMLPENQND